MEQYAQKWDNVRRFVCRAAVQINRIKTRRCCQRAMVVRWRWWSFWRPSLCSFPASTVVWRPPPTTDCSTRQTSEICWPLIPPAPDEAHRGLASRVVRTVSVRSTSWTSIWPKCVSTTRCSADRGKPPTEPLVISHPSLHLYSNRYALFVIKYSRGLLSQERTELHSTKSDIRKMFRRLSQMVAMFRTSMWESDSRTVYTHPRARIFFAPRPFIFGAKKSQLHHDAARSSYLSHRLYRAMLCLSAVFAVARCLSFRLSRSCIVSRRLKISSNFFLSPVAPSF